MKAQHIYVLYGSDRFTRDEQVRGLRQRMLEDPYGQFNLSELSGSDFSLSDVRLVADTLPFMADRRLVIVEGLVGRLGKPVKQSRRRGAGEPAGLAAVGEKQAAPPLQELVDYLADVPATTALVLVEDELDPSLVLSRVPKERQFVRRYDRPRPWEMARWIDQRVKRHGGKMETRAVRHLAHSAPDELRLIDNEIRKLVTYADSRPITLEDVELLCATSDVTVFALVDAIADGRPGQALACARSLFDRGERAEVIVGQIAAALRRLIQARELLDQRIPPREVQRRLGVHPYVAEKTERQARGYRIEQLERALRLLLALDHTVKLGEAEPEHALELFIADLPRAVDAGVGG